MNGELYIFKPTLPLVYASGGNYTYLSPHSTNTHTRIQNSQRRERACTHIRLRVHFITTIFLRLYPRTKVFMYKHTHIYTLAHTYAYTLTYSYILRLHVNLSFYLGVIWLLILKRQIIVWNYSIKSPVLAKKFVFIFL